MKHSDILFVYSDFSDTCNCIDNTKKIEKTEDEFKFIKTKFRFLLDVKKTPIQTNKKHLESMITFDRRTVILSKFLPEEKILELQKSYAVRFFEADTWKQEIRTQKFHKVKPLFMKVKINLKEFLRSI